MQAAEATTSAPALVATDPKTPTATRHGIDPRRAEVAGPTVIKVIDPDQFATTMLVGRRSGIGPIAAVRAAATLKGTGRGSIERNGVRGLRARATPDAPATAATVDRVRSVRASTAATGRRTTRDRVPIDLARRLHVAVVRRRAATQVREGHAREVLRVIGPASIVVIAPRTRALAAIRAAGPGPKDPSVPVAIDHGSVATLVPPATDVRVTPGEDLATQRGDATVPRAVGIRVAATATIDQRRVVLLLATARGVNQSGTHAEAVPTAIDDHHGPASNAN